MSLKDLSPVLPRRFVVLCLVLAALTFAAFCPVLRNEFIQYDDANYIGDNPHVVTGLSWANAKWAFTTGYAANWHPLTWLSHQLDVQFFGLRPQWHHLENLLFHIANSILLFLVLCRMMDGSPKSEIRNPKETRSASAKATADRNPKSEGDTPRGVSTNPSIHPPSPSDGAASQSINPPPQAAWLCFFVAALFAVHPLHVESVAWAAERKDVLSTFFFLLTLYAYVRYAEKVSSQLSVVSSLKSGAARYYVLALAFFALGLMSKPMLVTTPFLLLLLDYWPLGRLDVHQSSNPSIQQSTSASRITYTPKAFGAGHASRLSPSLHLLWEKLPFFALCLASSIATFVAQHTGHATSTLEGLPLEPRVSNAILSYLKYIGKTFWPAKLAVLYPHPGIHGPAGEPPDWLVVAAVLVLVAITISFVLRLKREPWLSVGWFWYLGTLVPVIGIVQVGGQAIADRYMYIPSIGLFLMLTWWAADYFGRWPYGRSILAALGVSAVLTCAVVTFRQTTYWRTNLSLFQHVAAVTQDNPVAEFNLGLSYGQDEKYDLAVPHFQKAIEIYHDFADAHFSLGVTLEAQGKTQEALDEYLEAVKDKPWHILARNAIGGVYWKLGKRDEALAEYREALRLDPEIPQVHASLGKALSALGDLDAAAEHLTEAIRLRPSDAQSQVALAKILIQQGKLQEAEIRCRQAVRLAPKDSGAHVSLAEVLGMSGKRDEAIAQLTEALRLKPDDATAHKDLGTAFFEQARYAEASTNFADAIRLKSDYPAAHTGLGRALAVQGRINEAVAQFREVARLCPTNAEALVTLGEALMAAGQTNDAAAAFASAGKLDSGLSAQNLQAGQTLLAAGQTDAALARFATAASLNPDSPDAHESLGTLFAQRGRLDDAARELEQTIRLRLAQSSPDRLRTTDDGLKTNYYNLAIVRVLQGRPADAIANYRQALALDTNYLAALNDLAWLLATDRHPEVRDGAEAVRLAEHTRDLNGGKEARFWGTLDAAYAEAGRFPDAIAAAQKAAELAQSVGQQDLADAAKKRLVLYQNHQRFRQ